MADDQFKRDALAESFRQMLDDGDLSVATLKTYRNTALAAVLANTTIIQLSFDGSSSNAQVTCEPGTVLAACNLVLAEQESGAVTGSGATHVDLSQSRIET